MRQTGTDDAELEVHARRNRTTLGARRDDDWLRAVMPDQLPLFGGGPSAPEGFRYLPDAISPEDEAALPEFLLPVRKVAARAAGIAPEQLQQALVTEYPAAAAIGWHRDKAVYGDIVGVSLLSSCNFRLRRKAGTTWERDSLNAEPRSAYLLHGPSRLEWEHSIPAVDALRYSITFRNLRSAR